MGWMQKFIVNCWQYFILFTLLQFARVLKARFRTNLDSLIFFICFSMKHENKKITLFHRRLLLKIA